MFPSQNSHGERSPISRTLLHSSFTVPSIQNPFQVFQQGTYEKMMVTRTFPSVNLRVPPSGSPHTALTERFAPFPEPSFD
jgi:hypothetical protein